MNSYQSPVMRTVTGNVVRKAYSRLGTPVSSYQQAVSAVGFDIQAIQMKHPVRGTPIANETGLFRSDNNGCLGIHSDGFSFVQPSESLKVLERARQIVGGQWSSIQVNKGGRMIGAFIEVENAIKAPNRGDTIALSLGLFDHFDGSGLARINLSACNLTCTNGMTGLKSVISFSSKHIGDVSSRLKVLEGSLQLKFAQAVADMRNQVTALDSKPMSRNEVVTFAEQLFPVDPEAVNKSRVENQREAIVTGFSRGTGNYGETRWDAFNAVTEYLDWQSTFRETTYSKQENRFESLLVGKGAKTRERALELLIAN
jgi:uncharacterized protein DUF932